MEKGNVKQQKINVMVYTSSWCIPCKAVKPILEVLAKRHQVLCFSYIDVGTEQGACLAQKHMVMTTPTVLFWSGNELLGAFKGVHTLEEYEAAIKEMKNCVGSKM